MKKKFLTLVTCILMAAAMVLTLAACGGNTASSQSATVSEEKVSAIAESAEAAIEEALTEAGISAEEAESQVEQVLSDALKEADSSGDIAKVMDAGKIIVGITDFAPMDYKEDGEWTGFDAELARKVGEELGLEIEFLEIDWDNKILELNAGTVDCIWNGMTLTDEVKNAMDCTDPYIINEQVVVMSAEKAADYPDAESMKDLTFAVEAGSAGANAAYDAEFANVTEVDVQSKALMEVAAGTSDACVIDSTMAAAMTGEGTSYENLTVAAELTSEDYGIGFRKGSGLKDIVNDLIKKYAEDGSLQELATKYNLKLAD